MNPTQNPFAPGAGTQPPELAGREDIIQNATVALARLRRSRPARSQILLGLRGVGKTVLLNRITPRERDYMRAMAELGPGPHRSGDIALALSIDVTTAAPLRNGLIKKGMIFSPQHGDTAFTVPMFDEFLRRSMPQWVPGSATSAKTANKRRRKRRGE